MNLQTLRFVAVQWLCSIVLLMGVALAPAWAETGSHWVSPSSSTVQDALMDHFSLWQGTSYKLGGTDARGVDCSSFIQTLFQEKFSTKLPRTSREQMTLGERVDSTELSAGDLLFFRTGPTRRHVGVYIGNGQFMHVSAGSGVEIAQLHLPYWQKHFITARRLAHSLFSASN